MFRPPIQKTLNNNKDITFQILDWNNYDVIPDESDTDDSDSDSDNKYTKKIKMLNIRAYGITENGNSICLNITGFQPYFYIRVPDNWKQKDLTQFISVLKNNKSIYYAKDGLVDARILQKKEFYGFSNNEYFNYVIFIFHNYMSYNAYLKILKDKIIEVPSSYKKIIKLSTILQN